MSKRTQFILKLAKQTGGDNWVAVPTDVQADECNTEGKSINISDD